MNTPSAALPPGLDTQSPDSIAAHAGELLDRQRADAARRLLRSALVQHPHHTGLLYEAARAEAMDDNPRDARSLLGQLLRQAPSHAPARFMLFALELEADHLEAAERIILDLLREYPQEPLYYAYYARLMLRALKLPKARQLADEALRLAPQYEAALHAKALCDLAEGRTGGHSQATVRLLLQHPDDARTLRLIVTVLIQSHRPREALRLAQELLRAHPNDQALLEQVKALRLHTHWSLLPLWPVQKWGWAGSAVLWVGMLIVAQLLGRLAPAYQGFFTLAWLGFVIYSWVWPPLLRRWLMGKNG